MALGLWQRLRKEQTPLEADLRSITEADTVNTPPVDVLVSVAKASHNADDRRLILRHLQQCLAETTGRRWRRVHGGLILLSELLKRGAPALTSEIAEGMHFDPVQRLTFLEKFDHPEDRRVQNVVRQKATALRAELIAKLQAAEGLADGADSSAEKGAPSSSGSRADTRAGTSSQSGASSRGAASGTPSSYVGFGSDGSAAAGGSSYVGFGSDDLGAGFSPGQASSRAKQVNGLVRVGHCDDTSSEESAGEAPAKGAGTKVPRRKTAAERNGRKNPMDDSTDSDSEGAPGRRPRAAKNKTSSGAAAATPQPVASVNLLGDDSPVAGPSQAKSPTSPGDLLGGFDSPAAPTESKDLLGGLGSPAAAAPAAPALFSLDSPVPELPAMSDDLLGGLDMGATPAAPAALEMPKHSSDALLDF